MIAVCGLDCGKCEARIATVNNDEALRQKVAREWSELNKVLITPEMICCTGCHLAADCEKLSMITAHNEEARRNLGL